MTTEDVAAVEAVSGRIAPITMDVAVLGACQAVADRETMTTRTLNRLKSICLSSEKRAVADQGELLVRRILCMVNAGGVRRRCASAAVEGPREVGHEALLGEQGGASFRSRRKNANVSKAKRSWSAKKAKLLDPKMKLPMMSTMMNLIKAMRKKATKMTVITTWVMTDTTMDTTTKATVMEGVTEEEGADLLVEEGASEQDAPIPGKEAVEDMADASTIMMAEVKNWGRITLTMKLTWLILPSNMKVPMAKIATDMHKGTIPLQWWRLLLVAETIADGDVASTAVGEDEDVEEELIAHLVSQKCWLQRHGCERRTAIMLVLVAVMPRVVIAGLTRRHQKCESLPKQIKAYEQVASSTFRYLSKAHLLTNRPLEQKKNK
jgi:hypothetical protein